MITIQKQDVAQWILAEYLANAHAVNEKISNFERKYSQTFEEFSSTFDSAPEEDYSRWDDLIEWKAYVNSAKDLAIKIDEVKHGNFEIA